MRRLERLAAILGFRGKLATVAPVLLALACLAPDGVGQDQNRPPQALSPWGHHRRTVVVAVGDLAHAGLGDSRVGRLLGWLNFDAFLALGDNAYPHGTLSDFVDYWTPVFGPYDSKVFPTPGNHEHDRSPAGGYKTYFSAAAPNYPDSADYYTFDIGGWRWFSLNSEIAADSGSLQYRWLRGQLASDSLPLCVGAYWHRPRFNAGQWGDATNMQPIWSLLAARGATLVLAAHDHNYQRWAPVDGITGFIVGTGGKERYPLTSKPGLAAWDADHYGVLQIALWEEGAETRFVSAEGDILDEVVLRCRA